MKRLLLVTVLLLLVLPAAAETVYRGETTLWTDTVWSGRVLVDGIVTVAPDITLTVSPGTEVRFTRYDSNGDDIGEHELFIQGRLLAQGTEAQPIVFTSAEALPRQGDWGALNMMGSPAENLLEHCLVEYAYRGFHAHFARGRLVDSQFRHNRRGAQFQESQVSIDNCRFTDNLNGLQFRDATVTIDRTLVAGGYWGIRSVYSDVTLRDCRIENNLVNGINLRDSQAMLTGNRITGNRRGLYLQRSSGTVADTLLAGNSEYGLFVEAGEVTVSDCRITGNGRGGIRRLDADLHLNGNNLAGNDLYALVNDGATDLAITGNAWGTVDPEQLAGMIRDGADRTGCGRVSVTSPLAALDGGHP